MAVIGAVLPDLLFGAAITGGALKQNVYVGTDSSDDDVDKILDPDLYSLTPVLAVDAMDPETLCDLTAIDCIVSEEEWRNEVIEFVSERSISSNEEEEDDDESVCLTEEDLAEMLEEDDASSLSSSCSSGSWDPRGSHWERHEDSSSDSSSLTGEIPDFTRLIDDSKMADRSVGINHRQTGNNRLSDHSGEHQPCKSKRGAKNVLLWKFLLTMLDERRDLIQWIDLNQGTFRFINTSLISKMWGSEKKKTSSMNFEKLSRGIRHYYKSGLMSRMHGQRLIYKFNWEKVPKKYRKC